MIRKSFLAVLLITLSFGSWMNIFAQVPQLINYQGMLTDANDNPLSGSYSIQFKIYNSASGGSALWTELQTVSVVEGIFSVILGTSTSIPLTVFDGSDKYLSIKVDSDAEMSTRKRLVSVGYSFRAYDADKVDGKDASEFVQKVDNVTPNSSGNIDLVAAGTITITPDNTNHSITISATGGTGGDDLGNHTATQNIKLNGHFLSNDGGDEGISIDNSGNITASGYIRTGATSSSYDVGDIVASDDLIADDDVFCNSVVQGVVLYATETIRTGVPSSVYTVGDIVATDDLIADDEVIGNVVKTGSPSNYAYSSGDIVADDDLIADDQVQASVVLTGSPSASFGSGDIVATRHLIADENVKAGNCVIAGSPSTSYDAGDVVADDDLIADHCIITGSPTTPYNTGDIVANGDLIADLNIYGDNLQVNNFIHTTSNSGIIRVGIPSIGYTYGDIAANNNLRADEDLIIGDHACINTSSLSSTYQLYVNGSAYATGSWYSSDSKFKKNITDIVNPLEKISNIRGVSYNWRTTEYKEKEFPEGKHFGVISQEIENVLPEIVKADENGEKAVAYIELIPVLIEAIKQQQLIISEMQTKLNEILK